MEWKGYRYFFLAGLPLLILLITPLLFLIWYAVSEKFWFDFTPAAFEALKLSIKTSLISCIIVTVSGTPMAFYFSMHKNSRLVRTLQLLSDLSLTFPPALVGIIFLLIFSPLTVTGQIFIKLGLKIPFSTTAVVLAQIFVISPFFIRAARLGFESFDQKILDAAVMDGATKIQNFFQIVLPNAKTAIASGITICWLRALGEFGATAIFAGNLPKVSQTISVLIYDSIAFDFRAGIALSVIVIIICWTALILIKYLHLK